MKNKFLLAGLGYLLAILLLIGTKLVAQVTPNNDSAAHYLKLAQLDKQNGRRLDLLKKLDLAIAFESQDPAVLRELATLLADQRKYAPAMVQYKKALTLNPKDTALLRQTFLLAYQLRQHEEVIKIADLYKKAYAQAPVALYLGKVYYETEDYGKAIQYLTQAGKENPTVAEVPYLLARSYADMMNFKGAIPFFLKALELDPKQPNWTYELGLRYYAIHDDLNALKFIQKAAEVGYKKDNDYMENLAIAHLNVGQFDQGVVILKEALDRRPSDFNLLNMMAEAYYGKGKFIEAVEYWDKILAYDKTNASALYMIGMSYQKMGGKQNADKGVALCDKAIEMDPSLAGLKQKKMMAGL